VRNIQIAEQPASSPTATPGATGRSATTRRGRRHRGARLVLALAIAVALIGAPAIGSGGDGTVDAAGQCFRIVDARFNAVGFDSKNLNGEWVVVKNTCARRLSIAGWRLRDRDRNAFRFPAGTRIAAGLAIKVHTGRGTRTARHVYMGRTRPLWDNTARERAYLIDPHGVRVSTWPRTATPAAPAPLPAPSAGADPWSVPFLSRTGSGPIRKTGGCDNLVIEDRTFKDLGADVEAIHLENCTNVTIRANDFARVAQAITILNSTNVRIEWNRYLDILGPHERVGRNRANFVQLVRVSQGYIAHNKGKGGDTEDVVSMYESGGTATSPFVIEQNQFEGTNWTSPSGSGIALGDGSSSYSIARDNILLNVGQVGVFIAGGSNHRILNNTIYGERRELSNVGLYVWNQSSASCSGHEVAGNRVWWRKADGASNASWDAGNCGTISGWSSNDWNASLDPATLRVAF
jgi:hypothetical protein